MNKHFELVETDTIEVNGRTLFRIRALVDLPQYDVTAGVLGGYIESPANLLDNAWVSGKACVMGNARVSDNAYVLETACVTDSARVSGNARVLGSACVSNNAYVSDNTWVSDSARLFGSACVIGNARVTDSAQVFDNARLYDHVNVSGSACIFGNARLLGNARVSSNAAIESTADYIVLGPAISSHRFTTAYKTDTGQVHVATGCFTGTIDQFEAEIQSTHANNEVHLKQYMMFVDMIKIFASSLAV